MKTTDLRVFRSSLGIVFYVGESIFMIMKPKPTHHKELTPTNPEATRTAADEALAPLAAVLPNAGEKAAPLNFHLMYGDALEQLRLLPDCSIHAAICDPPYGVTSHTEIEELLTHWLAGAPYIGDETGYAGTEWDNCVPSPQLWREVKRVLAPGGFVMAFAAARTAYLTTLSLALAGLEIRDVIQWVYRPGRPTSKDLARSDQAQDDASLAAHVAGWRATLRPGYEPIIVARKPLEFQSTVLENFMDYGVGALNHRGITGVAGRIATNLMVVHDLGCTRQMCLCDVMQESAAQQATHVYPNDEIPQSCLNVPKPLKKERPFSPDGTKHETVKPIALMRTLVRAVSLPGHTILDAFLGSGTTAEAALLESRNVIGCEMTRKYLPLIEQRIGRTQMSNPNVFMTSNLANSNNPKPLAAGREQLTLPEPTLANPDSTEMEKDEKMLQTKTENQGPRCLWHIPNNITPGAHPGALSRTDNSTEICSDCETQEAAEEHFGSPTPQIWWPANQQVA